MLKLIFLVCTISYCLGNMTSFDPERLRLIQANELNNNFIYAMGSPLTDDLKNFNISGILAAAEKEANKYGIDFPQIFNIWYTPMFNTSESDKKCLNIIKDYCLNNKNIFRNFNHNILGVRMSPYDFKNITDRNKLAKDFPNWGRDKLAGPFGIIQMLDYYNEVVKNTIFIYGNMNGGGSVSEFIGGYQMGIMGYSLNKVIDINNKIGNLSKDNINALEWYSLYKTQLIN